MTSRIIVKNLPKKISDEKLKTHFSKIGATTDVRLKFTKDGKFRQFAFIGFKSDEDAKKAIEYFNNTYIDASKITVEECKPLNDTNRPKAWSKHSNKQPTKGNNEKSKLANGNNQEEAKKANNKDKKADKLESLIGDLKDDEQFKEFLAANKIIKSRENIWKNDIELNLGANDSKSDQDTSTSEKSKKNKGKDKKKEVEQKPATEESKPVETKNDDDEADFDSGRLFVRNLYYECKEEDLEKLFAPYGPLVEVSMPLDNFSKKPKGFAFITCMFPEKALKAFSELDGTVFQGRMLHIIPAKGKKEPDENDASDLNFKQKRDKELKKTAQSSHNWNTLFINQNALANLMAANYNIDKSQIYDVHQTGRKSKSIAVNLAVGETQIVNDIKNFLIKNGVKLDAFANSSNPERSKTVILIKNLPNGTTQAELKELFKKNKVNDEPRRVVMPEYGIACLVEFKERQEAKDAFRKLAYKQFKSTPLYLEWAPVDVFDADATQIEPEKTEPEPKLDNNQPAETKPEVKPNKETEQTVPAEDDDETEYENNATLFVKNLNFDTDEDELKRVFSKIGKCKVTIARKISPNKEVLSMGYGFVTYKQAAHAKEAIKKLQNHTLDGHNLELKFSNRSAATDDKTNKRAKSTNKKPTQKSSKILIRNIPFEAKAKEIEELFRVFGELKYVRLPKRVDGTHRGFGFVDFVTISDAERAFEALSLSTHLFGRRLVLEWAEPEQTQEVEILRQKEQIMEGPSTKRLKKSKLMDDLQSGGGEMGGGGNADFNY